MSALRTRSASLRLALPLIIPRTRAFSCTPAFHKALPFSLHPAAAENVQPSHADGDHGAGKVLRMLMFGKPGAGKGTLSARVVQKYSVLALSSGDMLRQQIAERTDVGVMAEEIVASGALLPDDVMLRVIAEKLDKLHNKHWILDGFPRTLGQGKLLDGHLRQRGTPLSLVVHIDVPDSVILSRIGDRWIHLPSGRVYNSSYNPPKVPGRDDQTGEPLTKRPDDNPEVFARRLQKYYTSTSPLLSYFGSPSSSHSQNTKLVTLRGATSDEMWPQLDAILSSYFPSLNARPEGNAQKRRKSLGEATLALGDTDFKHGQLESAVRRRH